MALRNQRCQALPTNTPSVSLRTCRRLFITHSAHSMCLISGAWCFCGVDFPQQVRWRLTHRDTMAQINDFTGAAITTRGTYVPPVNARKMHARAHTSTCTQMHERTRTRFVGLVSDVLVVCCTPRLVFVVCLHASPSVRADPRVHCFRIGPRTRGRRSCICGSRHRRQWSSQRRRAKSNAWCVRKHASQLLLGCNSNSARALTYSLCCVCFARSEPAVLLSAVLTQVTDIMQQLAQSGKLDQQQSSHDSKQGGRYSIV